MNSLPDGQAERLFLAIALNELDGSAATSRAHHTASIIGFFATAAIFLAVNPPQGADPAFLGQPSLEHIQETQDMTAVRISMLALSATVLAVPCAASTIHVPADQPTIQAAVTAASNGDVIEIADGTYTENIVISGKKLTVQPTPGGTCVLESSHVSISKAGSPGIAFRGIRFLRSTGSGFGGAIEASDSEVSVSDCSFVGNSIAGGDGVYGGAAIYVQNCRLTIQSSVMTENSVNLVTGGYPFAFGGAVLADHSVIDVRDSDFLRNACLATVPGASWAEARTMGGAIALRWGSGVISNCRFEENSVRSEVHGVGPLASALGGAIGATGQPATSLRINDCIAYRNRTTAISDNSAYGGSGSAIGGAFCFGYWNPEGGGSHQVQDCLFVGNTSDKSPLNNGQSVSDIAFLGVDSGSVSRCRFGESAATALTGDAIVGAVVAWGGPQSLLSNSAFCGLNCVSSALNVRSQDVSVAANCGDCNGDGIPDIAEIVAGAPDNDADGIPDACQCTGDLNRDGLVNGSDMGIMLGFWGPTGSVFPQSDINRDGSVDGADIGLLLANWGPCPL